MREIGTASMLFLSLAFSLGCTRMYVPKPASVDRSRVGHFSVSEPVKLSNGWNSRRPVRLAQTLTHTYVSDLKAWTETAIGVLEEELVGQGMPRSAEVAKGLTLAITLARARFNDWNVRCFTRLSVETGDGYSVTLEANAVSFTMYRACSAAVSRAVARALNDQQVLAYLGPRGSARDGQTSAVPESDPAPAKDRRELEERASR
jgi:hypothetical protein